MKRHDFCFLALSFALLFSVATASADNPLITDQFTADPTARAFEGKIYLYPSHDIPAASGRGRAGWFVMEDYHSFSSEDLIHWTDHGVIVSQTSAPWTNPTGYAMWAPDCVSRDGKYYFYFPAPAKPATLPALANAATQPSTQSGRFGRGGRGRGGGGGGSRIGVAIADKPSGPFQPQPTPIAGVGGIDPCVFVDKDGQAYMYYAGGGISVVKLKSDMVEIDGAPQRITGLPTPGLIEGPFFFERNGKYYLTYPHVQNQTERLEYSMGDNPLGPFKWAGVIMDESPSGCWTNHHSLVQFKDQWYLFYHDQDLSPKFDKNRSVRADKLFFNEDGTIQKVIPTFRGVGIADPRSKLQIDRYSAISYTGAWVAFLDDADKFAGWKAVLSDEDAWIKYGNVDFGSGDLKSVNLRSLSSTGGVVEIHLDDKNGPLLAKVQIEKGSDWMVISSKLESPQSATASSTNPPAGNSLTGVHAVVLSTHEKCDIQIDWIIFE